MLEIKNKKELATLTRKKSKNILKKVLEFDFIGFPYLGMWAKIGAPFVKIKS